MKFYMNENGKVIVSKTEVSLQGWKPLIAGSTDAAQEKHVPVWQRDGDRVKVSVGSVMHPATEAHYISFAVLETEDGYQVKYFHPTEAPEVTFVLKDGDVPVAVYAYCNLHGLWMA